MTSPPSTMLQKVQCTMEIGPRKTKLNLMNLSYAQKLFNYKMLHEHDAVA